MAFKTEIKKLLKQNRELQLEREQSKMMLNKEKHDIGAQTDGTRIETLEHNLKCMSVKNKSLQKELDLSNKTVMSLKHELETKEDKLKDAFANAASLSSKIDALVKTIGDKEKQNHEINVKMVNLYDENNRYKMYKYDFIEASRERDEVAEEAIELRNK